VTDPTNLIDSPQRAAVMAHAWLRLAPQSAPLFWQSATEPFLAALLFAACPQDTGLGIEWVYEVVSASGGRSLYEAAVAAGSDGAVAAVLRGFDQMEVHRRLGFVDTMRHAVHPWLNPAVVQVS